MTSISNSLYLSENYETSKYAAQSHSDAGAFFHVHAFMEARTKILRQGEAPPNVPNNIPATTGDTTSSVFTKEALFVNNPPTKYASTLLQQKLRDSPVSSSGNPPTYIPPKNQHASPSQSSK